jgi:hypothetical protein
VWHEGVSGRNADDVMSAYSRAIRHESNRDTRKFTFYADNCSAQNKNWTLYSGMVGEVNRDGGPHTVTINYLEKGHTFMSADSFHAQVEGAMRKMKNVCDFDDFKSAFCTNGVAVEMSCADFRDWENGVSSAAFTSKPVLSDVCAVQFRRGSCKLYWKTSYDGDWSEGHFMKIKLAKSLLEGSLPEARDSPRGISQAKKDGIIKKLCPLMNENRRRFWESNRCEQ